MPPAKSAARRTSRPAAKPSATSPISRKEVEAAAARFDKALEDANQALQALGGDLGKGAKSAYAEITKALKALRRDAQKTNQTLLKDLEKLRASVTPTSARTPAKRTASKSSSRSTGKSAAAKSPSRTASKSTASKRASSTGGSRSTAKRPAGRRRSA